MPEIIRYAGICLTCRFGPSCIHLRNSKVTIWQCEEFEVYPYKPVQTKEKHSEDKSKKQKTNEKKQDLYKGLCCNCDNRKICKCPKPEGGVWHCEEYL